MYDANTLVETYVLDDAQYAAGAERVVKDTGRAGNAMRNAASEADKLSGALDKAARPRNAAGQFVSAQRAAEIAYFSKQIDDLARKYDAVAASAGKALTATARAGGGATSVNSGGKRVATVGHLNWLVQDDDPPAANTKKKPKFDPNKSLRSAGDFLDEIGEGIQDAARAVAPLGAVAGAMGAIGVAAAGAGFELIKRSAEFDALRQSLLAVEGDSKKAKKALADLKEIAKAPGLGFEGAIRSYTGLRNAGYDQEFTERLIKSFATANARGGGSNETFSRIMEQIKQAATKDYLSQEDLRPISDAGVPINSYLKKLYGTGDTEELKSKGVTADKALHDIVAELEKLPKVAESGKVKLDNLFDKLKFDEIAAGDALSEAFMPMVDEFAAAMGNLGDGGVITSAFDTIAANIKGAIDPDSNGMEEVAKTMLVASMDFSAAVRNVTGFFDGIGSAWEWLNTPLSDDGKKQAAKTKGEEFDTSLAGEHERNVKKVDDQAAVSKERREMHSTGFKGNLTQWEALKPEQRNAMLEASKNKVPESQQMPTDLQTFARGLNDGTIKQGTTFEKWQKEQEKKNKGAAEDHEKRLLTASERTANATEKMARGSSAGSSGQDGRVARAQERIEEYKRRQTELSASTLGGGELARTGIASTELSGRAVTGRDRLKKEIAEKIDQLSAWHVVNQEVANARHSSRSL